MKCQYCGYSYEGDKYRPPSRGTDERKKNTQGSMGVRRFAALALAAVAVACALGVAVAGDAEPIELTAENFDEKVGDGGVWLVEFYGSRCGHCKRLQPNYDALAAKVAATEGWSDVRIAKLNANEHMAVARRFNAFPWPSIKLFVRSVEDPVNMEQPRGQTGSDGVDNMFNFIAKEAGLGAAHDDL